MKLSKYNLYREVDNKVLIFNFLSNEFGVVLKEALLNEKFDSKKMIEYGFAVDKNIDEDILARYKYKKMDQGAELNLTILASENCNFCCQYCFDEFNGVNIDSEVSDDIVLFVRKNIHKFAALNIDWFGGEPLLAIGEIERISEKLIQIGKSAARPIRAGITTNGYLLDLDNFKKLLKCRIQTYEITLDGFAKTHDKNRPHKNGMGTFDRIMENLRNIRDNIRSRMFQIVIRVNVTQSMLEDDFVEFASFLKREFGEDLRFSFRFSIVYDWGGERIETIKEDLLDSTIPVYNKLISNGIFLSSKALIGSMRSTMCVYAKENSYTIRPDGGIIICPQINLSNIGYLKNGKLEIDEYKLAKWTDLSAAEIEGCKNCSQYYLCKGRVCPANLKEIKDNGIEVTSIPCRITSKEMPVMMEYIYRGNRDLFIECN